MEAELLSTSICFVLQHFVFAESSFVIFKCNLWFKGGRTQAGGGKIKAAIMDDGDKEN